MDFAIFIASHISYDGQLDLLNKAIGSIKNQDYNDGKIDIWLSISFDNETYSKYFDDLMISEKVFKCFKQDKQLYQLEHFEILNSKSYNDYNYEFIFFIDDDDEYDVERISAFYETANNILKENAEKYVMTQVLYEKALCIVGNEKVQDCLIYWCYGVRPVALNAFFGFMKGVGFKSKYGDFLLKMFFERLFCLNPDANIKNGYYLYNTENDNSISNNADKTKTEYLYVCMNDKKFLKKLYGSNFKSKINKKLWDVCYDNFHKYKYQEDFLEYAFNMMFKYGKIDN